MAEHIWLSAEDATVVEQFLAWDWYKDTPLSWRRVIKIRAQYIAAACLPYGEDLARVKAVLRALKAPSSML